MMHSSFLKENICKSCYIKNVSSSFSSPFSFFFKTVFGFSMVSSQVVRKNTLFRVHIMFCVFKTRKNAHIAQLSCTLVCLKPTALFWDNIRFQSRIQDDPFVSLLFQWVFCSLLHIHTFIHHFFVLSHAVAHQAHLA